MKIKAISIILLFTASITFADYEIPQYTIDGGGGTSSGGDYVLTGTIGQSDADSVMSGGDYILNGGFWPGSYGCIVNLTDLALFLEQWLNTGSGWTADLAETDGVDVIDFSVVAEYWLDWCPAGQTLK